MIITKDKIPPRELRILIAHVCKNPELVHAVHITDQILTPEQIEELQHLVQRRLNQEPIAKIIGQKDFWKDTFLTNQHTLDPRPDSETLIELALEIFPDTSKAISILDLGTGTGCLLFSLLKEYRHAWGVGIDKSQQALAVALKNQHMIGLINRSHLVCGSWSESISGHFDLVISNPPYISPSEKLDESTQYDPKEALFAENSGLADYYALLSSLKRVTRHYMILELGFNQEKPVTQIAKKYGWNVHSKKRDLGGHIRALALS